MERLKEFIQHNEYIQLVKKHKDNKQTYLVGGTIRDIMLGIAPNDYDFAISGSGVAFARTFAHKIKGAFVLLDTAEDEARVVKDEIIYDFIGVADILNDLQRRDFTINAIAINLDTLELLDPFQGLKDIKKKIIRPTSRKSLTADPLRVLRGFRFSLELDFKLAREFFTGAKAINLFGVASERIGYELMRIISADRSYKKILKLDELGLFKQIFPEAKKIIEDHYLWGHSLNTYCAIEELMRAGFFRKIEPEFSQYFSLTRRIPLVKLAGLFHDVAKPDTFLLKEGDVHFYGHDTKGARIVEVLGYQRLKLPKNEVTVIKKLVKEHMRLHLLATNSAVTERAIRRFFRDLGEDYFGAMMIAWADGYATAGWTRHLEDLFMRMIELKRADEAKPKVERLINGYDLIALGLKPGPIFKTILQEIFDMQLEEKLKTKEEALKYAIKLYKKE